MSKWRSEGVWPENTESDGLGIVFFEEHLTPFKCLPNFVNRRTLFCGIIPYVSEN